MHEDTTLSIKTKKEVKELAQMRAEQLGIPLGTVINVFLREFGRTGTLHAQAYDDLSTEGQTLLRDARKSNRQEKLSGPFETAEQLNDYLDSLGG